MPPTTAAAPTLQRRILRTTVLLGLLLPILGVFWALRRSALDKELIDAIKTEDTKTALYCLHAGADPNTRDPYEEADGRSHSFGEVLDWLKHFTEKRQIPFHNPAIIALFVDQVYPDQTPQENLKIAGALLDHGADINARDADGSTPLMWALSRKWNKTAHLLLERGADVHLRMGEGFTTLMAARGELTEQLIQQGADVRAVDTYGSTALHYVSQAADLPAMRSLIAHGAEVNAVSQDGSTPLLLAAWSRRPESLGAMRLLLAHGADVRAQTSYPITVLARSVQSGNAEKVKLVLSRGVDINVRMRNGRTALMMATGTYANSPEVLMVLLEHGADVNAHDIRGDTAFSQALRNHHDAEIRLLKAAGAKEPPPSLNPPLPSQAAKFGFGGPRPSR